MKRQLKWTKLALNKIWIRAGKLKGKIWKRNLGSERWIWKQNLTNEGDLWGKNSRFRAET